MGTPIVRKNSEARSKLFSVNFLEQRASPGPPISERTMNPGNTFKDPEKLEMGAKKGGSEEKKKFHGGVSG